MNQAWIEQRMALRLRISGAPIAGAYGRSALVAPHSPGFLAFMFVGGAFLLAGIALYFYSVVSIADSVTKAP